MEWYIIAALGASMLILNYWNFLSRCCLFVQVLRCFGVLGGFIVISLIILLPIRFLTKVPSFVFRKLLHMVAFSGISLMILLTKDWQAAAITSGLLALVLYPVLSYVEKKPWFGTLFVQKSKGEIKKSMLLLFLMFTAMILVAWGKYNQPILAAASIVMWGTGDAAAALVGIPFGKHKVRSRFTDGKKSWEGSPAMFLVCFVIGLLFLSRLQSTVWTHVLLSAGIGALAGTVTELVSPSEYDTITVPVVIVVVLLLSGV